MLATINNTISKGECHQPRSHPGSAAQRRRSKKQGKDKNGTPKEKKELSEEEKEYKSKRKEIQEKLIKFATRIPK